MGSSSTVLWLLVVLVGNFQVYGQEDTESETNHKVSNEIEVLNYFSEYGWLRRTDGPEELITADKLRELISVFQKKYGLKETGEMNNETAELMSMPRCGNPDFDEEGFTSESRKRRFVLLGQQWTRSVVTWFIEGYPLDNELTISQVHEQIRTAFQRWGDASSLTLAQASNANSADIRLKFATRTHNDNFAFDGPRGTLAHAFPPGGGIGGDVHFDDDEVYSTVSGIILHQVATHEIGHSLGLAHSDERTAVMAPFYREVPPSSFVLHSDDIAGLQEIYGRPTVNSNTPPAPQTPPPTPPTTITTPTEPPTPTPTRTIQPIFCNGRFDAVTEGFDTYSVFLFQGTNVFKYDSRIGIVPGYPIPVNEEFPGVYGFIDAALTYDNRIIYLFKGDNYWRFENRVAVRNYPRSITLYWGGVPANLDAAFVWSGNRLWYFVKDNQYYRYNILSGAVDRGYPRPLSAWRGVTPTADAVATFQGSTYFFQGQYYQRFNDRYFQAYRQFQTAPAWLGCVTFGLELETTEMPTTLFTDSGSNPVKSQSAAVLVSLIIYLLHFYQ